MASHVNKKKPNRAFKVCYITKINPFTKYETMVSYFLVLGKEGVCLKTQL